ncbi:Protein FATTY ACID EXPORT 2, chloroplastic [Zea mays]|uniref:Protein FATTY ACID EXPORT 2, chloroplastic n=1 Tax=Zea mays TaxID=4577 RepID=A0A3L6G4B6_MAIZE|nr:Protein FATTY ACID EXPORT 2, chloroplastic [Zea mays]
MGHELSMSQKLSLAYAALVGAGGVMGYMKSGSQKSLGAVGTSAMVLYFVYIQLPVRPVFASSIGLGISGRASVGDGVALQEVREDVPRLPAGVVSLVSLIAFELIDSRGQSYDGTTENMVRHSITSGQRSINVTKSTGVAVRYAVLRNPLQNTT